MNTIGEPFKDVQEWADFIGLSCWIGYGDGDETDIEKYIKDNFLPAFQESMIAEMKRGKYEFRPAPKKYDWREVL